MSDWKKIVGTVAPWIGTALGGPLGGLAVGAIADVLGLSDKTEASIKAAISGASAEDLLRLKVADQEFALKMQEMGFQNQQALEKLSVDDRDSARKREIGTQDSLTPRILATIAITGFLTLAIFVVSGYVDVTGEAGLMIGTVIGMAGGFVTNVYNYYFGSSAGSQQKSIIMGKMGIAPTP